MFADGQVLKANNDKNITFITRSGCLKINIHKTENIVGGTSEDIQLEIVVIYLGRKFPQFILDRFSDLLRLFVSSVFIEFLA